MVLRRKNNRVKLSFLISFSVLRFIFCAYPTRTFADNRLALEDGNVFLADSIKMSLRSSPVATMGHGFEKSRKYIIIVSHGRSGSTLMDDIFNHHPSVFYMYEPLQTAQRVLKQTDQNMSYSIIVEQLLIGIFVCKICPATDFSLYREILPQTHTSSRKPSYCIATFMLLQTYRPKMGPTALLSNDKRALRKSL